MRRSKLKPEQAEKVENLLYFNDEKIKTFVYKSKVFKDGADNRT